MRWTGGQYSLYRVALAVFAATFLVGAGGEALATREGLRLLELAIGGVGFALALAATLALAIGLRDRLAAQLLAPAVLVAELFQRGDASPPAPLDVFAGRTALLLAILLLAHARVPAAPFGSFEARGRIDPRGGWQRPAWQSELGLVLLLVVFGARFADALPTSDLPTRLATGFEVGLAAMALFVRARRTAAWAALLLFQVAWSAASGVLLDDAGCLLLLAFAVEPTAFEGRSLAAPADRAPQMPRSAEAMPAVDAPVPARLFYDGDCGFCHRSVRFVLSEELATPTPLRLRFAPLGSETFRARLAAHPELDPARLPDSIVLELEDGTIRTRSGAALEIAARLGGFWRLLALAGSLVPSALLDLAYDAVARIRKLLFTQPKDACPILPPDLRARFDP